MKMVRALTEHEVSLLSDLADFQLQQAELNRRYNCAGAKDVILRAEKTEALLRRLIADLNPLG